jgi:hypothetical protein
MSEVFGFQENLGAGPPDAAVTKYYPSPGEVVVEVYDKIGNLLFMDSFDTGIGAPRTSCYVSENMFEVPYDREKGVPGTYISLKDAANSALFHWECPVDMPLPFDVPEYITSKPGSHHFKMWWGSHKAE